MDVEDELRAVRYALLAVAERHSIAMSDIVKHWHVFTQEEVTSSAFLLSTSLGDIKHLFGGNASASTTENPCAILCSRESFECEGGTRTSTHTSPSRASSGSIEEDGADSTSNESFDAFVVRIGEGNSAYGSSGSLQHRLWPSWLQCSVS